MQAYEKAVSLLPNDALWHYGFADLLWKRITFASLNGEDEQATYAVLFRALSELQKSQQLGLDNENVYWLTSDISNVYPWAVTRGDGLTEKGYYKYNYLILTATPTAIPATGTPTPEATSTPQPQTMATLTVPPAATDTPVSPTKTPEAGLPLCGGAGLGTLPALAVFWLAVKKKRATHL